MMRETIMAEEFASVLSDIQEKIARGDVAACSDVVERLLSEYQSPQGRIDREYIDSLLERKRQSKIENIDRMLVSMTLEQIENVHKYTQDEYDEPNHEAEALDAIMNLSHKKQG